MLVPCYRLHNLYQIEYYTESWAINPKLLAMLEKECGPAPGEGQNKIRYYEYRYYDYIGSDGIEAALYFSDEVFDPENYNENSIKRESKIAF